MPKSVVRWIVNVVAFVVFAFQALSGVFAWLLPRGGSLRHGLHELHLVAGVLLVVVVAVHLALHWAYILENLKKYGLLKR